MNFKQATRTLFRILGFSAKREEIEANAAPLLIVALVITWIVGLGRWWDDPREVPIFVRMGFGSVLYVLSLAAALWMVAYPITLDRMGYRSFLAFVAATSLPGLVYAVPIEQLAGDNAASTYNLNALGFVSLYRVSLLVWFYWKILEIDFGNAVVATLLPISGIVLALTGMGHGARVMDIMGGLRDRMPKSAMEEVIGLLGCLAWVVGPVCLLIYLVVAFSVSASRR